jgi:hypothetical protein
MKFFYLIVKLLVLIGALNWGLIGFFKFDLVAKIFGDMTTGAIVVYDIIGVAALFKLLKLLMGKKCCKMEQK